MDKAETVASILVKQNTERYKKTQVNTNKRETKKWKSGNYKVQLRGIWHPWHHPVFVSFQVDDNNIPKRKENNILKWSGQLIDQCEREWSLPSCLLSTDKIHDPTSSPQQVIWLVLEPNYWDTPNHFVKFSNSVYSLSETIVLYHAAPAFFTASLSST